MKDRLQKLLTVKSLVTILLTLVFCYLAQSTKEIAVKGIAETTSAKESGEP